MIDGCPDLLRVAAEFSFDGLVEAFQFRRKTVSLIAAAMDLLGFAFKRD